MMCGMQLHDGLPMEESLGKLEPVFHFNDAMPTGVTVSHTGRIFVNFPKWGDDVAFTVSEIRDNKTVAYPDEIMNQPNNDDLAAAFVSVQSVVVDPVDRLWVLDTGSPMLQPTKCGGPKLVGIDLSTNKIIKKILFPEYIALPSTYLNDIRSEHLKNFLPMVEGRPFLEYQPDGSVRPGASMGSDGIAISSDGSRLYYSPLNSRRLYSIDANALVDHSLDDKDVLTTVADEGDKGGASDGLESDALGNIYSTNYEHNAIMKRSRDGRWETLIHDSRLLWPDTLSLATDGYLYVTANQLHRQAKFNNGHDLRRKPYTLFRTRVDAQPILLR